MTLTKTKMRKRDALTVENLDWALGIAAHVAQMIPDGFEVEDLTGPAMLALLDMATRYDPTFGVPFQIWARRRVYGACFDSVRRREYKERAHRSLTARYAAAALTEQTLADDQSLSPEAQLEALEQRSIWQLAQQLPSRHALVILAVYGGGMTLEALAQLMPIKSSRLCQIHREALEMLRASYTGMSIARRRLVA